jgi:predicted nucleotide-binding protein
LSNLTSLIQKLDKYHYGIFLLTPDDKVESRERKLKAPRDNVILELGLWLGRASRDRAFFVVPKDIDLKLPSDLSGINPVLYDYPTDYEGKTIGDLTPLFASAADKIRDAIVEY